jgi:hypothetical protein
MTDDGRQRAESIGKPMDEGRPLRSDDGRIKAENRKEERENREEGRGKNMRTDDGNAEGKKVRR